MGRTNPDRARRQDGGSGGGDGEPCEHISPLTSPAAANPVPFLRLCFVISVLGDQFVQ